MSEATETTVTTVRGEDETTVTTGQRLEAPQAAADDQDGAVVAFLLTSNDAQDPQALDTSVAQAATGTLTEGLGAPAPVSPPGQDADDLSLGVARAGAGVLAWTAGPSVYAARRAPAGAFGSAEQVAVAGAEPATAVRADGSPIIVFSTVGQILAVVGAGSGYELPVALGPGDPSSGGPAVSADARGGAAATWIVEPGPGDGDESIRVAELQPDPQLASPPPPPPPPPPPVAPPPAAVAPSPPPALTGFAVAPPCIRYGAPLTGKRARLSFAFVLSEAASVGLTIQRRLNSRAQRRCPSRRAPGEAGQLGPAVVIDMPSGGGANGVSFGEEGEALIARAAHATRARLTVMRRLNSGRRRLVIRKSSSSLAAGTYVATVTAVTADGRVSTTAKLKFWVVASARSR